MRLDGEKALPPVPEAVRILPSHWSGAKWWDAPNLRFKPELSDTPKWQKIVVFIRSSIFGTIGLGLIASGLIWSNTGALVVGFVFILFLMFEHERFFVSLFYPDAIEAPYEIDGDTLITRVNVGAGFGFLRRPQRFWLGQVKDVSVKILNSPSSAANVKLSEIVLRLEGEPTKHIYLGWGGPGLSPYDFANLIDYRAAKARGVEPRPSTFTLDYAES